LEPAHKISVELGNIHHIIVGARREVLPFTNDTVYIGNPIPIVLIVHGLEDFVAIPIENLECIGIVFYALYLKEVVVPIIVWGEFVVNLQAELFTQYFTAVFNFHL
jgi:hypothetical protein